MITIENIYKRYRNSHGVGPWILKGVDIVIPTNANVGLIGRNGAGKTTLLGLIGGIDSPNRGTIRRDCRLSFPLGLTGGLHGSMTGRQNARFVCRLLGHEHDMADRIAFVEEFAELGSFFDEPVSTYSSGMGARLKFGLSLAFDFEMYMVDELTGVGDKAFQRKSRAAFRDRIGKAGLIMVSHSEGTLRDFCQSGIWLHEGKAHWFDEIDDAIRAYGESQKE